MSSEQNLFSMSVSTGEKSSVSLTETASGFLVLQGFNQQDDQHGSLQQLVFSPKAIAAIGEMCLAWASVKMVQQGEKKQTSTKPALRFCNDCFFNNVSTTNFPCKECFTNKERPNFKPKPKSKKKW